MKIRQRALSILLALTMVLTFMPAMAFASSDAATPVDISFSPASPVEGYIGSMDPRIWNEGNSITVKYSGGKSSTYKYVEEEGEYYLNGDTTKDYLRDVWAYTDTPIKEGKNNAKLVYRFGDDENGRIEADFTVVGVKDDEIKSVSFKQKNPLTVEYIDRFDWSYNCPKEQIGNELTINYSYVEDGETVDESRTYKFMEDPERAGEYGFYYKRQTEEETWYEDVYPDYVFAKEFQDWTAGSSYTGDVYFHGVKASGTMAVSVKKVPEPTSAKFIASNGKAVNATIGQDFLELDGKGNKIVISYSDNTKRTYTYKNSKEGFVYKDSRGHYDNIWGTIYLNKRVKKGTSTVKGKLWIWSEGSDKQIKLSLSAKAKASKYYTYVIYKGYQYTGKKITPNVEVNYYNGKKMKTMPTSWYKATPKKNTKIGDYSFKVSFKSKYQKKYGKSITGYYGIVPKTPVIGSVTAGTGSMTVSWKKFSASDRKNIDGFRVEYSTDKNFENDWGTYETKKTDSKATINNLKSGKKYYVRVSTYKIVKTKGSDGGAWFSSHPSKTKTVTVK